MHIFSVIRNRLKKIDNTNKLVLFSVIILISLAMFIYKFIVFSSSDRFIVRRPISRHFNHVYQSLKKIDDLKYVLNIFKKSNLPTYHMILGGEEREKLYASIPIESNLHYGLRSAEYKQYVSAFFKDTESAFKSEVDVRLRGLARENWSAEKMAFRIKFPKDNFFKGMSALNLFIPRDRHYYGEMINSYRAKKLGLLAAEFNFVNLNINKRNFGVYLASEPWTKEWLARNNTIDTNNVFSERDNVVSDQIYDFKSSTAKNEYAYFEELVVLRDLVANTSDDEFYKKIGGIIDLDKLYRWQVLTILAQSDHQADSQNSVLLFRKETGKFEYIPWDLGQRDLGPIYEQSFLIVNRILKNKKFFEDFKKVLADYVLNEDNLKDDLEYYDNLTEKTNVEFYKDFHKLDTSSSFDVAIVQTRDLLIENFHEAKELLALDSWLFAKSLVGSEFRREDLSQTSFKYFNDIFYSIDQFLNKHHQFKKLNNRTVVLKANNHIFSKTVVVPQNLRLIIEPGAKLFFFPDISLISYSPVRAVGEADAPIIIEGAYPSRAWGVFGVINTGADKNIFSNIWVSGGSSDVINGVDFLSQFSVHNSTTDVRYSVFSNSQSDDSFHAILSLVSIRSCTFINNYADGVDIDFSDNAVIENNLFVNRGDIGGVGGDAIDLSGSRNVKIGNNTIRNFADKCLSIGEHSKSVEIYGNFLTGCNIGIAVKDKSDVSIDNTTIVNNRNSGISLYNKKPEFIEGGSAVVKNSIIWDNNLEIDKDELSRIEIENSTVMGGYSGGTNINSSEPNLGALLNQ